METNVDGGSPTTSSFETVFDALGHLSVDVEGLQTQMSLKEEKQVFLETSLRNMLMKFSQLEKPLV